MRIYLDVCCLNRTFDDLSQDRIYLEAEAILSIVSRCEKNEWTLLASGVIEYELSRLSDLEKLDQVRTLYSIAGERIKLSEKAERRAALFQRYGIKSLDSIHIAVAEANKADAFLTTDDRLLSLSRKVKLDIIIANPVAWLMEAIKDEK